MRLASVLLAAALPAALLTTVSDAAAGSPDTGAVAQGPKTAAPDTAPSAARPSGSYVVQLRQQAAAPMKVARAHGVAAADVSHVYRQVIRGYSAHLTARQVADLRTDPQVAHVDPDTTVTAAAVSGTQDPAPWHLVRISDVTNYANSTSTAYSWAYNGTGESVFILDTGIETRHSDFTGRASNVYNTVKKKVPNRPSDCYSHGTQVAGLVGSNTYGVAKGAGLLGVRVLGCDGVGRLSDVLAGMDYVYTNSRKPVVALLAASFGTVEPSLQTALENSRNAGIFYVMPAGNANQDACTHSPVGAAYTVGAIDQTDQRAFFSDYGSCVDIYAPGVAVTTLTTSGTLFINNRTIVISGTSMSAALAAGAAARLLSSGLVSTPAQIETTLTQQAQPLVGDSGLVLHLDPISW